MRDDPHSEASKNPYASPQASLDDAAPRAALRHADVGFLKLLSGTWEAIVDNVATFAVMVVAQLVHFLLVIMIAFGLFWTVMHEEEENITLLPILQTIFYMAMVLLLAWYHIGVIRVALPLMRGERFQWWQIFTINQETALVFAAWLPLLLIHLGDGWLLDPVLKKMVDSNAVIVQWVLFFLELGIAIFLGLIPHFLLDRRMSLWEAAGESITRVGPNFLSIGGALVAIAFLAFLICVPMAVIFPHAGPALLFGFFCLHPLWCFTTTLAYLHSIGEQDCPRTAASFRLPPATGPGAAKIAPPPGFERKRE